MSYAFKLAAAGIAILLAGGVAIALFSALWMQMSLAAGIVVVGGGLLLLAWRIDKRDRAARAGIEELPRI